MNVLSCHTHQSLTVFGYVLEFLSVDQNKHVVYVDIKLICHLKAQIYITSPYELVA